jgi:capsular polysaccharide biosynthesis protein
LLEGVDPVESVPRPFVTRGEIAVVLVAGVMAAIVGFLVSTRLPSTYEGRATLLVGSASGQYTDLLAAQILTQTYAQLVVTQPVLEAALARSGLANQADSLDLVVRAVPIRDSLTVTIVAAAKDPAAAAAIANAVAAELSTVGPSSDPRLDASRTAMLEGLDTIAAEIATVRTEVATLEGIEERTASDESRLRDLRELLPNLLVSQSTLLRELDQLGVDAIRVIDPARIVDDPVSPNPLLNAALAFVTALALGAGLVALSRASAEPSRGARAATSARRAGSSLGDGRADPLVDSQ